jgi:cellulose synthase/poly-beta-1,6-N-acetylglucosamine synthase-like glycosyltransferase
VPPSITFVLPALNEEGPLFERALGSIREQDYPPELVEIIVADGGSTDGTRSQAKRHGARVLDNPNRLAEWGSKVGMLAATSELVVFFAADNELVGRDWLTRTAALFESDSELAAVFGRLCSGEDDAPLNKYVALIQSEPLNWFLNRNLEGYLARATPGPAGFSLFEVEVARPLVWGANGLVVRRAFASPAWEREGYMADVDAFHLMVAAGHNRVAYRDGPYVYHHQVAKMSDLRRKWVRNSRLHLVGEVDARELDWVLVPGFRRRALLFGLYSAIPVFSAADAARRAVKDRSVYWLYHPAASFVQTFTYVQTLASTEAGRQLVKRALLPRS